MPQSNKHKSGFEHFNNVVTRSNGDVGEMFLYGYIGMIDWRDDNREEEDRLSITDIDFLRAFRRLEQEFDQINIHINSAGGSIYHGQPIISAIQSSSKKVHTINDGLAASMAGDIFMAGHVRHMPENALLMFHASNGIGVGTAKDLRSTADLLDKYSQTLLPIIAKATGKSKEEVYQAYFEDYEDHWFTAEEALQEGFINSIESYRVETPVSNPQNLAHKELVEQFMANAKVSFQPKQANNMNLIFEKIKAFFGKEVKTEQEAAQAIEDGFNALSVNAENVVSIEKHTVLSDQVTALEEEVKNAKATADNVAKIQATVEQLQTELQTQAQTIAAQAKTIEEQATTNAALTEDMKELKAAQSGTSIPGDPAPKLPSGGQGSEGKTAQGGEFLRKAMEQNGMKLIIKR